MEKIEAKSHLHPEGYIVESANLLADAVLEFLRSQSEVEISMIGMRGTSSSYFNTIIQRIVQEIGVEAMERRVKFIFDSNAQREIFGRSLAAVTKSVV